MLRHLPHSDTKCGHSEPHVYLLRELVVYPLGAHLFQEFVHVRSLEYKDCVCVAIQWHLREHRSIVVRMAMVRRWYDTSNASGFKRRASVQACTGIVLVMVWFVCGEQSLSPQVSTVTWKTRSGLCRGSMLQCTRVSSKSSTCGGQQWVSMYEGQCVSE